jgi:hypothetical protein
MGNGALATGPKLPRPSLTLPDRPFTANAATWSGYRITYTVLARKLGCVFMTRSSCGANAPQRVAKPALIRVRPTPLTPLLAVFLCAALAALRGAFGVTRMLGEPPGAPRRRHRRSVAHGACFPCWRCGLPPAAPACGAPDARNTRVASRRPRAARAIPRAPNVTRHGSIREIRAPPSHSLAPFSRPRAGKRAAASSRSGPGGTPGACAPLKRSPRSAAACAGVRQGAYFRVENC